MKMETIESKGKIVARVYLKFPDCDEAIRNTEWFVSELSKDIVETEIGYAGFRTKQGLHDYLASAVFGKTESDNEIFNFPPDEGKIIKATKKAIILCFRVLPADSVHIFVFPTFSKFVKEKMSGTTGYTPWKNTMFVFIHLLNRQWEKALSETVAHEFNHSVFLKHNKCESLLDSMIFEGLAEHFREQTVGGKRAPWTKVLNLNQSRKLFFELQSKDLLGSTDEKVYRDVFFGNKKYTLWTGYTIGYFMVGSFLRHYPPFEWKETMITSPQEIFKHSRFSQQKPQTL